MVSSSSSSSPSSSSSLLAFNVKDKWNWLPSIRKEERKQQQRQQQQHNNDSGCSPSPTPSQSTTTMNLIHIPSCPKSWRRLGPTQQHLSTKQITTTQTTATASSFHHHARSYDTADASPSLTTITENDPERVRNEDNVATMAPTSETNTVSSPTSTSTVTSPDGRCSHTLTTISDTCVLLIGGGKVLEGCTDFIHFNDVWMLHALTAEWIEIIPHIRYDHHHDNDNHNDGNGHNGIHKSDKHTSIINHTSNNGNNSNSNDNSIDNSIDNSMTRGSYWGMKFEPARRGHMATWYDPYVIVFGGMTNDDQQLNDVWLFHTETLRWKQLMFKSNQHHDGDVEEGGDDVETIHPSSSSTSSSCLQPPPRRNGHVWIYGEYMYLVGGHTRETLDTVYRLGPLSIDDPDEWSWSLQSTATSSSSSSSESDFVTSYANLLHKRAPQWPTVSLGPRPLYPLQFAASCLIGDKLWIFGGLESYLHEDEDYEHRIAAAEVAVSSSSLQSTNLFYRLDLQTWQWSIVYVPTKAPTPRYFHSMSSMGRFCVVMGGIGLDNRQHDEHDSDGDHHHRRHHQQQQQHHDEEQHSSNDDDNDVRDDLEGGSVLFDVYYFDTVEFKWYTGAATKSSSPRLSHRQPTRQQQQQQQEMTMMKMPSARNAFAVAQMKKSLIIFGGGIYPRQYYHDTYVLEIKTITQHEPNSSSINSDSNGYLSNSRINSNSNYCHQQLCQDMGQLFESGLLSDVTLQCHSSSYSSINDDTNNNHHHHHHHHGEDKTKAFAVHKAILASRCEFFRTMFCGPYAESSTSVVMLDESLDADVVELVLRFLYTGQIHWSSDIVVKDPEMASSVLQLVDFWGIESLMDVLEDAMGAALLSSSWMFQSSSFSSPSLLSSSSVSSHDHINNNSSNSNSNSNSNKNHDQYHLGHDDHIHPLELISFAKAHHCDGLVLKCLAYCKRHQDKLDLSEAEPAIVEEIEDYINSLL